MGFCLTLGNELFQETHVLTRKRLFGEGATGWRAAGSGNPGELLCHVAHSFRFFGDGVSFRVISGQSFRLTVLPGVRSVFW